MSNRRWINNTQPQTLQVAVLLLYLNAVFFALAGGIFAVFPLGLAIIAGQAAGGFGIANERKWGYVLSVVMACLPLAVLLLGGLRGIFGLSLLTLMFEIALVALLIHPQSREYQKIWFH